MSVESDIAALRAEVARLAQKGSQPPPQNKDSGLAPKLQEVQRDVLQLRNWQQTLRGEDGVTVQGNVIRGTQPKNVSESATTDVAEFGCLNGAPASGLAIYRIPPAPL